MEIALKGEEGDIGFINLRYKLEKEESENTLLILHFEKLKIFDIEGLE